MIMKVIINGKTHEIKTQYKAKQSDAYYKALEDCDACAAHFLYQPPYEVSWEIIQHKINLLELRGKYESEQERIRNMSPAALEYEIKNNIR